MGITWAEGANDRQDWEGALGGACEEKLQGVSGGQFGEGFHKTSTKLRKKGRRKGPLGIE